jgi:Putative zinc-finger domain
MERNDEHHRLDELVGIHERYLRSLTKRKTLITQQLQSTESRLSQLKDDLNILFSKHDAVREARRRHIKLQKELEVQLRKSEEKLKQISNSFDDPISVLKESECDGEDQYTDDDEIQPTKSTNTVDLEEPINQIQCQEANDQLSSNCIHQSKLQLSVYIENPWSGTKGVLSLFQINQKKKSFILHRMIDAKRLGTFMDITIQDLQSLDDSIPLGRHRRESLVHTCLLPVSVRWENDPIEESKNHPYELTLCPYELMGECADPYCTFQHFSPRKVESQLHPVYEFIPLPEIRYHECNTSTLEDSITPSEINKDVKPLRYNKRNHRSITLMTSSAQEEGTDFSASKKNRSMEFPETDITTSSVALKADPMKVSSDIELAKIESASDNLFDKDFIALPFLEDDDDNKDDDESLTTDDHNYDCEDSSQTSSWWWTENGDPMECSSVPSTTDWMRIKYGILLKDDNTLVLKSQNSYETLNTSSVLQLLGRILSAIQFSLYSGRYDWGKALCCIVDKICEKHAEDVFPCQLLKVKILRFTELWNLNNSFKSNMELLYEHQLYLYLLKCCVRLLYLKEATDPQFVPGCKGDYYNGWTYIISNVFPTTSGNSVSSNDINDNVRLIISSIPGYSNKETLSLQSLKDGLFQLFEVIHSLQDTKSQASNFEDLLKLVKDFQTIAKSISLSVYIQPQVVSFIHKLVGSLELVFVKESATRKLVSNLERELRILIGILLDRETAFPIVMTPILVLHVTLLVALRRYEKSQRALEEYLIHCQNNSILRFSDLLWSQLATLRSRIPLRSSDRKLFTATLSKLEIKLNHISLVGDRSLFQPFIKGETNIEARLKLKASVSMLMCKIESFDQDVVDMLDLGMMKLGSKDSSPDGMINSARLRFPRTLFYCGPSLRKLKLTLCQIDVLPPLFGDYFPNLQVSCIMFFSN